MWVPWYYITQNSTLMHQRNIQPPEQTATLEDSHGAIDGVHYPRAPRAMTQHQGAFTGQKSLSGNRTKCEKEVQ
jgi:hypothetical protein